MSTVKSIFLQHLNGTTPNATMDTNGNFTVGGTVSGASSNMFRNRIINGDMRIDQRNAGGSVTVSTDPVYVIDRWRNSALGGGAFSVQRVGDAPAGFTYSQKATITTVDSSIASGDYYSFNQPIEGYNTADLAWGTSSAKTVTVSFWVKSSITGSFAFSLSDGTSFTTTYVSPYTINSANTWEYKTITIPGPTSGTWNTTTGASVFLVWGLGSGSGRQTSSINTWNSSYTESTSSTTQLIATNGATFYITGVQLEVGTAATPFEFRSLAHELSLCQRYYQKSYPLDRVPGYAFGQNTGDAIGNSHPSGFFRLNYHFPVSMRAAPTMYGYDGAGNGNAKCQCYITTSGWTSNNNLSYTMPSTSSGFWTGHDISNCTETQFAWVAISEL